jgi:hypothetical protein
MPLEAGTHLGPYEILSQLGAGGIQSAQQLTGNAQDAGALSNAYQSGATNNNIGVRVLSPGNDGAVTQSNDASSTAQSTNTNTTNQSSDQDQSGTTMRLCACDDDRSFVRV